MSKKRERPSVADSVHEVPARPDFRGVDDPSGTSPEIDTDFPGPKSGGTKNAGKAPVKSAPRVRFSGDLPRPRAGAVPYAKSRPELADLTEAKITELILDSDAWLTVMDRELAKLDAERARKRGAAPMYSSRELESVLLYGRVCGLQTYKQIRARLAGDRGREARELLGLDRPRPVPGKKVQSLRSGVPSEATLSRHRLRFGERRRRNAYLVLERRLLEEHLAAPELRDEAELLDLDGTPLLTHFTAPMYEKVKKGKAKGPRKLVNGGLTKRGFPRITAPDAGYMPPPAGVDKCGNGWNLISVVTQTGVPLSWRLVPLNSPEYDNATELVQQDLCKVIQKLGPRRLRVLSADGAFTGPEVRRDLRELGVIENIHPVSHGQSEKSKKNVAKADKKKIPIVGYPNWYANGHRELRCVCGKGRVVKRVKLGPNGQAIVRAEGQCDNCKSVTITSGEWALRQNPEQLWRVNPAQKGTDKADLLFGNPLTFHDVVAQEYGNKRFGHNEGFHGQLESRFRVLQGKRWIRRRDQAMTECAMTFCVMHAVALEQRRRVRAQAQAPPLAA